MEFAVDFKKVPEGNKTGVGGVQGRHGKGLWVGLKEVLANCVVAREGTAELCKC